MTGYLEKNLQSLGKRNPVLKERLQWPSPDEYDLEWVGGEGALKSLRRRTANGQFILLHSSRDPEKEANRWADAKVPQKPVFNLIVFGAGLWYHIWSLAYRLQGTLDNLIIVEQSEGVIRKGLEIRDLTPILGNEHTVLLVNPSPQEFRQVLNNLLTTLTLDDVLVAEHEPSMACAPEFYAQLQQTLEESLEAGRILLRTKVESGGMIQENILRNLPAMFSHPSGSLLHGILKGTPGFIVAAGPSLDRNKHHLRKIGERGLIIAVDTTYPILRREGIHPHISVTADPTPLNLKHYADFPQMDETFLFFSPSVYWQVLKQVEATLVSLPLPFSKTLSRFPTTLGVPLYLKPGLNVAQTALSLAIHLGCDPIVFVGLDLSFGRTGGGTHAEGAALRRTIAPSSRPGHMVVELLGSGPTHEEFEPVYVPGNEGQDVPTSKFWLSYLRSIEQDVSESAVRCINATEGGAKIDGTEIMSLVQAIDQLCVQEIDIRPRLQRGLKSFYPPDPSELARFWDDAETVLQTGVDKSKEGQELVAEIETRLQQGNLSGIECADLAERIVQVHRELVQDQQLYCYLDEAADRVLSPFLKKSARARGEKTDPANLRVIANRYGPFFKGMEQICGYFLAVVRDMSTQTPKVDNLDFNGPLAF